MLILLFVSMIAAAGAVPAIANNNGLLVPAGQEQEQHLLGRGSETPEQGRVVASSGRSLRGFVLDNDVAMRRRVTSNADTTTGDSLDAEFRQLVGKFTLSPTSSPIAQAPRVYERPENINSQNTGSEREPCGLLGYSIFCPTTFQGVIGRFLSKYLD